MSKYLIWGWDDLRINSWARLFIFLN